MDAMEYLTKLELICQEYENKGKCSQKCPLMQYNCGQPKTKEKREEVIRWVKNYQQGQSMKIEDIISFLKEKSIIKTPGKKEKAQVDKECLGMAAAYLEEYLLINEKQ